MTVGTHFGAILAYEIGGGWGSAEVAAEFTEPAYVIRGTDIPPALLGDVSDVPFRFHKPSNLRSRQLQQNDIVFEVSGGSKGQPVGRALLVSRRLLDSFDHSVVCASFCKLIRVDPTRCNPRYVFRRLQLAYRTGELDSFQVQSTGITNFRWKSFLEHFLIDLPDKHAQRAVVRVLDSIDDLIENNRRRIELLEQMAQAIYREWFVHFRYLGHEDATFVDSPLGPIPEGWEAVTLADLVSTQYGYTESAHDDEVGPRYLRGMDINKTSFIDWSTVPFCPIKEKDRARFQVVPGDVFIIRMADPGKVGICERDVDAVFASYLVRLRPVDARLTPYFLFFSLRGDVYQGWITGASTGATRKSVSAKVMTEPLIALPPTETLAQFDSAIKPHRTLLNDLIESNRQLAAIRDLLLPKLVTGQIDVSSLDLNALPESVA